MKRQRIVQMRDDEMESLQAQYLETADDARFEEGKDDARFEEGKMELERKLVELEKAAIRGLAALPANIAQESRISKSYFLISMQLQILEFEFYSLCFEEGKAELERKLVELEKGVTLELEELRRLTRQARGEEEPDSEAWSNDTAQDPTAAARTELALVTLQLAQPVDPTDAAQAEVAPETPDSAPPVEPTESTILEDTAPAAMRGLAASQHSKI